MTPGVPSLHYCRKQPKWRRMIVAAHFRDRAARAAGTKRLELMRQLFPASTLIAVLVNPNNPNAHIDMPDLQDAARTVGQSISFVTAGTETEIDAVFATLSDQRVSALLVNTDPYFAAKMRD
jgi:putative ABC transport system substrate-binding protein